MNPLHPSDESYEIWVIRLHLGHDLSRIFLLLSLGISGRMTRPPLNAMEEKLSRTSSPVLTKERLFQRWTSKVRTLSTRLTWGGNLDAIFFIIFCRHLPAFGRNLDLNLSISQPTDHTPRGEADTVSASCGQPRSHYLCFQLLRR